MKKTAYKKTSITEIKKIKEASNGLLLEDLSSWGQDVSNKTFSSCLLKDLVIESSHMENNTWSRTRTENLNARESVVINSVFSHCVMPDTNFEAAAFEGVSFFSSNLRGSNFKGSTFDQCSFEGANLSECNFKGADLSGCNLYDCASLEGAIFDRSTMLPFSIQKAKELGMVMGTIKLVNVNNSSSVVATSQTEKTTELPDNVIDLNLYRKSKNL